MMGREWKYQPKIDAESHISAITGQSNIDWDELVSIDLKMVVDDPSIETARALYSSLYGKYSNYYSMLVRINPQRTKELNKGLKIIYRWLWNANKYLVETMFIKIIPELQDINIEIEDVLQDARYKYRIGEKKNRSFKSNMEKLKEQIESDKGEEDGD